MIDRSAALLRLAYVFALASILLVAICGSASAQPTFQFSFGGFGSGDGQFDHAAGLATDNAGHIWVVDEHNNRVEEFNEAGEYLSQFGSEGSEPGQFNRPTSVAIDPEGDLWVTDAENYRIEKFNDEGGFLQAVGSYGSGNGQFAQPEGLAIDPEGNIWVADTYNGRVQELNAEGEFLQIVGSYGSGEGQLGEPADIDIAPNGDIWIADWMNNRISVFSNSGEFIRQFGSKGSGNGQFFRPDAIDVDAEGSVWVGDEHNERIMRFDETGEYLGQFGTSGEGPGKFYFSFPFGLEVDESGHIWVADPENNRVQRWRVNEELSCGAEPGARTDVDQPLVLGPGDLTCKGEGPLEYEIVSGPDHGEITELDPKTGALTYVPNSAYAGLDSFTFEVHNAKESVGPVSFEIEVGDGPECEPGELSTGLETALPIELNCEGSAPLEYAIVTGPVHGEVTELDPEAGTMTYVPASGYAGFDSFAFVANNPLGTSAEAYFQIAVGDPATCTPVESSTRFEKSLPIELSCEGSAPLEYAIDTPPVHGEVTELDPEAGTMTYVPESGYFGPDRFEFFGFNPLGPSAPTSVDIQVGSGDPIAAYAFDEEGGEVARDPIGGHDASVHGAERSAAGRFGAAFDFDGEADRLTVPGSPAFDLGGEFTLEAWVRPAESHAWSPLLVDEDTSESVPYAYLLYSRGEGAGPAFYVAESESTTTHLEAAEALPVGEWSHLAITSDGEDLRLYVDGELEDTSSALAAKAATGDLQIGGSPALGQYFKGRIDEVRVYGRGLSPSEIAKDRDRSVLDGFGATILGVAAEGQYLLADPGIWPGSGRATFEYQWFLCDESGGKCEAIEGARGIAYLLGHEDLGHTFRVQVSAGPGSRASVRSAPTDPVTEGKPEAESEPQIFGHVAQGKLLTVSEGEWFPESATRTRQWRRCNAEGGECEDIAGAEAQHYVPQPADVGSTLRVAVTATSSGGSTTEVSEPTETVAAALIENTVAPTITEADGASGTELTAHPGTWVAEGEIDYGFQWLRCDAGGGACEEVEGATASTYTPDAEDLGSTLRARVNATMDGEVETATSAATSAIEAGEPVNVVAPTVSGQVRIGGTLQGTLGTWTGLYLDGLTAQWQVCDALGEACEALAGEEEEDLELTSEEVGSTVRLQVTASNGTGSTSAQSSPTTVVAGPSGPPPSLVSVPSITGLPEVGEELSGSPGVWSGAVEYQYQWERCDVATPECDPIGGAEEPTYVATSEDVGFLLRLAVTALAEDEASSSASAESSLSIRAAGAPADTEAPAIEGPPTVGATLSVTPGAWTGEPVGFKYRWQRCDASGCRPIAGATGSSYELTTADTRQTLRAAVTAENSKGKSIVVTSLTAQVDSVAPFEVTAPTVSGGSRVGESLTVTNGAWNGEAPISFAYAWLRCDSAGAGCGPIAGAEGSSYELQGADVGHVVRVAVTASNLAGEAGARSLAGAPISAAAGPISNVPPAITGEAEVGQTLSVGNGSWEGAESYAYQWQRCAGVLVVSECANIPGATGATYATGYEDAWAALRVAVTATGPGGQATAVAQATGEVLPSLVPGQEEDSLAITAVPTLSGEAREGQVLTVTSGSWSSYLPLSFEYAWRRCGVGGANCKAIEGADESSYFLQGADVGGTVRGVARASNGSRARVMASSPSAVVARSKPSNEVPPSIVSLEGNGAVDGEVLVAEAGSWFGSGLEFSFQWQSCDIEGKECEDIDGAEEETVTIGSDQVASTMKILVIASNDAGSVSAASALTKVVAAAPPVNDSLPGISGEAYEEGTLEASNGEWSGSPKLTFAYQWQRCDEEGAECEAISGATTASHLAVSGDVGSRLRVVVTASNEAGSLEAASEPGEVIGPPFLPQLAGASPSVAGFPYVGRTLRAEPGEWEGHAPIEFSYQWRRCNEAGEECADIPDATALTYPTTSADLGARVRVEVTATNSSGETSEGSEPGEPIGDAAPFSLLPPAIGEGVYRVGSKLESSSGSWSGSGPLEFAYSWERCNEEAAECVEIAGETGASYTAGPADAHKTVRSVVSATGPLGSESQASEAVPVLPPRSVNSVEPSIAGSTLVGETLTADSGEWLPEPDEFTYQWQRCSSEGDECESIAGAEGSEYTLGSVDAGATVRVVVGAQNLGEEEAPVQPSEPTAVVENEFPVNIGAPTLSTNPPIILEKITANPGTWVGEAPIAFHYAWQLCTSAEAWSCEDIGNMTNTFGAYTSAFTSTYELYNRRFRVEVTAENSHGSAIVYSAISKPAVFEFGEYKSPPENVRPPSLYPGGAAVGDTLVFGPGIWSAITGLIKSWQRCDAEGESCSAIAGSHGETYSPTAADIGHTLRGVVTGVNHLGEETVFTEPSDVVVGATPPENGSAPEITGTLEVGQALQAIEGEWSGSSPIQFDYRWKRCDTEGRNCVAIAEETYFPSEHLLRRGDVGSTLRLQVTASNGWGSVSATSRPTQVVLPAPPIANLHPASWYWWLSPDFGDLYRVPYLGEWEGEPEVSYQWQRCDPLTGAGEEMECADISGATDAEGYIPRTADVGFKLRLEETGTAPSETVHAYSDPAPRAVRGELTEGEPFYLGRTVPGQVIKASSGLGSAAGLPTSTEYRFFRLGEEGAEEVQAGSSPEYEIAGEDLGRRIRIQMILSVLRADEATVLQTPEVEITTSEVEVAPTNDAAPEISGEALDGATLHAEPGSWHGGGGSLTHTFQWRRCDEEGESCADIAAATKPDLQLGAADVGSTLRVVETTSSGPLEASETSLQSAIVVAAAAPESEESPTISGDLAEFGTAEGSTGAWTASEPVSYAFQWQRCAVEEAEECFDIDGATEPNLPLDRLEVGRWLRLVVKATNAGGSATAASELVGPVELAPPPQMKASPGLTILGPAAVGSSLITDGGEWEFVDPTAFEYQWLRCDEAGEGCKEIGFANGSSYQIVEEDIGSRLQVEVTAGNSSERLSANSELTPAIGAFGGSVDGSIVYLNGSRDQILLGDLEEESEEEVADCESLVGEEDCTLSAPSISPNEKMIAVAVEASSLPGEGTAIVLLNFDGTEPRLLAEGSEPEWSPDGTELYFSVPDPEPEEGWQIVSVRADGSNADKPKPVFTATGTHGSVDLSPENEAVVYAQPEDTTGPEWEWRNAIYLGKLGEAPRKINLRPEVAEAFAPHFSADGTEIIFTAIPANPKVVYYGEEVTGLYNNLHQLWAMNSNGTNPHPIVPESPVTYAAPEVVGDQILVGQETATYVSVGDGGFIRYSDPRVARLDQNGGAPRATSFRGVEPTQANASSVHRLALAGHYACQSWGVAGKQAFGTVLGYSTLYYKMVAGATCNENARDIKVHLSVDRIYKNVKVWLATIKVNVTAPRPTGLTNTCSRGRCRAEVRGSFSETLFCNKEISGDVTVTLHASWNQRGYAERRTVERTWPVPWKMLETCDDV